MPKPKSYSWADTARNHATKANQLAGNLFAGKSLDHANDLAAQAHAEARAASAAADASRSPTRASEAIQSAVEARLAANLADTLLAAQRVEHMYPRAILSRIERAALAAEIARDAVSVCLLVPNISLASQHANSARRAALKALEDVEDLEKFEREQPVGHGPAASPVGRFHQGRAATFATEAEDLVAKDLTREFG